LPFYPPYNYPSYKFGNNVPRLLARFPLHVTLQSERMRQARHFIRLIRRGISEYNSRLDRLDREFAEQPGGWTGRPHEPTNVSYGPRAQDITMESGEVIVQGQEAPNGTDREHDDDRKDEWDRLEGSPGQRRDRDDDDDGDMKGVRESHYKHHGLDREVDDDRDEDSRREREYGLGRLECEAVFQRLARDRIKLNSRGFPYADEFHGAQRDLFPDSSPLSRREIVDAWATWISEGQREEFGRERRSSYREHTGDEQRRRSNRHRRDDDDTAGAGAALSRGQIHHLFEVLNYKRKCLTENGYPYRSDVGEEQARIYPDTCLVSSDDIEQAWYSWQEPQGKREFRDRSEIEFRNDREGVDRGDDRGRRAGRRRNQDRYYRQERGQSEHWYGDESRERDSSHVFRIFDEQIANYRLSRETVPHLIIVNEVLRERGIPEFRTANELLLEWRRYLLAAVVMRAVRADEPGETPEGENDEVETSGAPVEEERPVEPPGPPEGNEARPDPPRRRPRRATE
jgi:hypothetical protein